MKLFTHTMVGWDKDSVDIAAKCCAIMRLLAAGNVKGRRRSTHAKAEAAKFGRRLLDVLSERLGEAGWRRTAVKLAREYAKLAAECAKCENAMKEAGIWKESGGGGVFAGSASDAAGTVAPGGYGAELEKKEA